MITFDLVETQAEDDVLKYDESFGVLVVKNDVPQLFIPIPQENLADWSSLIRIDPENVEKISRTTRVYSGIVDEDLIFIVDKKLF